MGKEHERNEQPRDHETRKIKPRRDQYAVRELQNYVVSKLVSHSMNNQQIDFKYSVLATGPTKILGSPKETIMPHFVVRYWN